MRAKCFFRKAFLFNNITNGNRKTGHLKIKNDKLLWKLAIFSMNETYGLIIKIVISDRKSKLSVFLDPAACRDRRIQKIQYAVVDARSFQNHFCCADAFFIGVIIDRAVYDRTELDAVFSVENNAVNGIRKKIAFHSIHYDIADGDLAEKRLASAFRINNA